MTVSRTKLAKDRIVEAIKYDFNSFKYPLVFLAKTYIGILQKLGQHEKAFNLASGIYRTGWAGSYNLGLNIAKFYFVTHKHLGERLTTQFVANIQVLDKTNKFFDDPTTMLNGIVNILKAPSENEKGAILLNYSYYFPLLLKFYDVNKISNEYNIILEPSWAGFCELSILAYCLLANPIFVQTYEKRDFRFIRQLNSNLIPIEVGPSWFVDHTNFLPPEDQSPRDIDIIMVAGWAKFKRHNSFFKALATLKEKGLSLKVTLVGYPTDMTKQEILKLAEYHTISDLLTIHELIKPHEVAKLFQRAKINILWSKFEGNNRAIIEGMFCDTPVILREGHNYGQHYDFINSQTGCYANDRNLAYVIEKIFSSQKQFKPRNFVMKHRNCIEATNIMSEVLQKFELESGRKWTEGLAIKINELHRMNYLDKTCHKKFSNKYKEMTKYLLSAKEN